LAVDATRRWPCLTRRMSPHTSVNGQAPRRRPRPARPGGPAAAYGRRSGPCEALRTPVPSTDALGSLFTLRVASQRRDSTAKALAKPLLERCKPLLGAGGAVLGRCKPCCSLPSAQFSPKTPRFRRFRLQRLHTFLTNSRFHIIYLETRNFPIRDVRDLPKAASFSNLG
jgi:hypothetical protein